VHNVCNRVSSVAPAGLPQIGYSKRGAVVGDCVIVIFLFAYSYTLE
jgi:hypothetical protein